MQKILTLLTISFLFGSMLYSQDLNQVDDLGKKQGKWRKTYLNGVIKYEGQFRDDHPYGEFRYYHENAQLKAITWFSDDGIVAHTSTFHENGQPLAKGKYINQKRDSTWNFYSDIDGKLITTENYKRGQLHGKSVLFYVDNGVEAEVTHYVDGKKEGDFRKYFPDGKLMTKGNYLNDQLDGEFVVYYNNGSIEISGKYKNGIKQGNWDYFTEEGTRLTEEEYKQEKIN